MELEEIALRPNLMKQALLISLIRCKANPPSFLGRHTYFQLTKLAFCFVSKPDHRKFLIVLSMEPKMDLGMDRTIEMCMGMLAKTCLTKINLPVKDKDLALHPESLDLIITIRDSKLILRGQPLRRGAPRYLQGRLVEGTWRVPLILCIDLGLYLPKKRRLLLRLIY